MQNYLLHEWARQEAVILAWPDDYTAWLPWLGDVEQVYLNLIQAINNNHCTVLLLIRPKKISHFHALANKLPVPLQSVLLLKANFNDTWLRDYGFLTCQSDQGMQPVEFVFNGWGNKFPAELDNQLNQQVLAPLCRLPMQSFPLVCEGGALEIDDNQHLLTTRLCLLNPERNGDMSLDHYNQKFTDYLGTKKITVFENGHLQGDDTDGHIDTLVRFTPDKGLVVQSCNNRPEDQHFSGLSALVEECRTQFPGYKIFELPLPKIVSAEGDRLPASYANFLINNTQILCPVYQQPEDDLALAIMQEAYPSFEIVPIDCLPLVQQFGSLHCISMQVPEGTLKEEVVHRFNAGVIEL